MTYVEDNNEQWRIMRLDALLYTIKDELPETVRKTFPEWLRVILLKTPLFRKQCPHENIRIDWKMEMEELQPCVSLDAVGYDLACYCFRLEPIVAFCIVDNPDDNQSVVTHIEITTRTQFNDEHGSNSLLIAEWNSVQEEEKGKNDN